MLSKIDGITEYEITETKENGVYNIKITVEADADIRDELFGAFARLGAPVYKLAPETVSLEEMFLRLTNTVTPEEIEEGLSDNSEDVYYEYDEIDGDEVTEDEDIEETEKKDEENKS